jgi:octaprenyl-diphosphate synthase
MQVAVSTSFPESVIASVHTTIANAISCDALPVRDALILLLSGGNLPIRALVTSSLHFDQTAIEVGTSLDLIHASLQRLHARLDTKVGTPALLGTAATVLVGDYLTTGAFRLLVHCSDMRILVMVSDAVNRASELESLQLNQGWHDRTSIQSRMNLAAPLSEAAGAAGAILAGFPESLAATARHFSSCLVSSYVLLREAENITPPEASARLHAAARNLCLDAERTAENFASTTQNGRPLELVELVAQRINEAQV